MAKFVFLLFVAICLAQNFYGILAEFKDIDGKRFLGIGDIQEMLENKQVTDIQNSLRDEMRNRLETKTGILEESYYKKNINKDIADIKITLKRIFKFTKEEIKKLSDDSSFAEECSMMAYEELDDLNKKARIDVANCVAKGNIRTRKTLDNLKDDLLEEGKALDEIVTVDIMRCIRENKDEDVSACVDMNNGVKIRNELEKSGCSAMDSRKIVLTKIAEDVSKCLKEVKVNMLINTEDLTDKMKSCINQV